MSKHRKRQTDEPNPITQEELQELVDLVEPSRRQAELRQSIINRLDAGAQIEPGKLAADLDLGQRQHPSWDALAEFFTATFLDQLREMIPNTPVRHLRIHTPEGELRGWGVPRPTEAPLTDEAVFEPTPRRSRKGAKSSKPR